MLTLLAQTRGIGMPEPVSTYAHEVDGLWNFVTYVSIFFTVLNLGLMIWFAYKYRQRNRDEKPHGHTHNTTLEVTWSVIPLIIVMAIFVWGFRGYLNMATPPANSYEILATAWRWAWEFTYPNGAKSQHLHVPADRPVRIVLESRDVIHAFFVPEFRTKRDVVPGRYNKVWFQVDSKRANVTFDGVIKERKVTVDGATETEYFDSGAAQFPLYCAEYCGTNHSKMNRTVYVHTQEGFDAWMSKASRWWIGLSPVEHGERLYSRKGCNACHSLDGSRGNGPSFKNLFGYEQALKDGSVQIADEAFLREAILYPNSQGIAGYQPVMPKFNFKESEVSALIAFIKARSDRGPKVDAEAPAPTAQEQNPETLFD